MARDVKKLLRKRSWTGKEVGELFILDLCAAWASPDKETGFLTAEDRDKMVARISDANGLVDYAIYKEIHNVIMKIPQRYALHREIVESNVWRAYYFLDKLCTAEEENMRVAYRPRIMTQKQFDEQSCRPEIMANYEAGVAILHPDYPPREPELNEEGYYVQTAPIAFRLNSVEAIYEKYGKTIPTLLAQIELGLSECYATVQAVRLIAEALDLEEVKETSRQFGELPHDFIELINDQTSRLPGLIERRNAIDFSMDEEATRDSRVLARKMYRTIDVNKTRPAEEDVQRAREYMQDKVAIYTRINFLYGVIRGTQQ